MDPASYAEATSPLTLPDGRDTGAGLGWFSGTRGGLREVWHTGSTPGYRCRVSRFTNLPGGGSAAVIIMCNADSDMTDDFGDLSAEVIHILLGDLLSPYEREEGPLPPIEGRYSSDIGENLFCDVSMIGGEISLRGSVRCIRSGAAAYRIKALDGGLRFAVRGPSDVTVWFGGGCMAICDVGRMTYLTRREG